MCWKFVVYSLLVFFLLFLFCQFDFFVVVERDIEKREMKHCSS